MGIKSTFGCPGCLLVRSDGWVKNGEKTASTLEIDLGLTSAFLAEIMAAWSGRRGKNRVSFR
jgi:hypothetical protein